MSDPVCVEELRRIFFTSLDKLLSKDKENLINGVHEVNWCARLAMYLEEIVHSQGQGYENYFADVEYNRNAGGEIKTTFDQDHGPIKIRCDLILHGRGGEVPHENLIAIEMKKECTTPKEKTEKKKDIRRLQALTMNPQTEGVYSYNGKVFPENVCDYKLGYFIEVNSKTKSMSICEFANGKVQVTKHLNF